MIAWGDLTLEACLREDTLNFLKGSNFYADGNQRGTGSVTRGLSPFHSDESVTDPTPVQLEN